MSIQHLKTLVAIVEQGGFGAAAETVFLSQSAVSLQMKSLEEKFRVKLFDRTKRPPILNQIGRALVPKAREIIAAYDGLIESVAGQDLLSGELSIGAIPSTMSGLIPNVINALIDIYSSLHIVVSPDDSPHLMTQVDRCQLDAAVISEPPYLGQHLEFKPFAEEPLIVLAPLDCALENPRDILRSYPFIRFTRTLWAGQWIDNWLRQENIPVKELMELGNHEMISAMVHHNLGVSIVPSPCIPPPNPVPLKRISLSPTAPPRILGVLVRRDNPNFRLTNVFFEQVVRVLKIQHDLKDSG